MKKYNCWEELKTTFKPTTLFECEGETFEYVDLNLFPVDTPLEEIIVKNTVDGVKICKYHNYNCWEAHYRTV